MRHSDRRGDDAGGRRMLLLEDDPLVARAITRVLQQREIDHASSYATAVSRMEDHTYAGWLIDVGLPDGSGLALLAWARTRGHRTPALVMTGQLDPLPHINEAQRLGAHFVVKPCSHEDFYAFDARCSELPGLAPVVRAHVFALAREWLLASRERDVFAAAARGVDRAAIHLDLGISEHTVRSLVTRLLRKADLGSCSEPNRTEPNLACGRTTQVMASAPEALRGRCARSNARSPRRPPGEGRRRTHAWLTQRAGFVSEAP